MEYIPVMFEVVCDGKTEIFDNTTASTGLYKELVDAGRKPEFFMVRRGKFKF